MQCLYWEKESGNSQQTIPLVHKITFKQIVEVLFQCFLNTLEQHGDNLSECNFEDLNKN